MGKHWRTIGQMWIVAPLLLINFGCMKTEKNIVVAMTESKNDSVLDPSQLWLADKYVLMDNLSIKLVHINAKNDYELVLADKIDISKDGTEVEITLKTAYFSDGTLITATDVVRSFKRLALHGAAHIPLREIVVGGDSVKSLEDEIEGLSVISKRKLKIKLKSRVKEIIYYLTLADMGVVHESLTHKKEILQEDWQIVSGAFSFKDGLLVKNSKFLLSNEDMPTSIRFQTPPTKGSQSDLLTYDIGYSAFLDKSDNNNTSLTPPYKYTSASFDTLAYLVLNTRRSIFKDIKRRQKINKLISDRFLPDPRFVFFRKANQFFLPDSFAFQKTFNPSDVLPKDLGNVEVPDFTILATVGTKKYTPPNLEQSITNALGNKTTVSFSDDISLFKTRKIDRSFDAYLVPTSMSYNVVTETLNLLYRSNVRFGDNPNGRVIKLIDEYQKAEGTAPEIIEMIVKEMTIESEIIPLAYASSPKFYNSDRIDVSEMNSAESLTFWKIRVK